MNPLGSLKSHLPTPVRRFLFDAKLRVGSRISRRATAFEPYEIEREAFGERLHLYIGNSEGRLWYDENAFGKEMWEEMLFLKERMVEEGDVIFDCGAHHGMMTTLFAKWVGPEGFVTAFDPVPDNVRIIGENLIRNGISNAKIIRAAVGAAAGQIRFSDGSNASVRFGTQKENVADVIRLDDYAHLKPTFLKIDVEGFEAEVLRGAEKILATRPKVMMEVHGNLLDLYGTSVPEVLSFLDPDDYELWMQENEWEPPTPFDPSRSPGRIRFHIFALPK